MVLDWYDSKDYEHSPALNPKGPAKGFGGVIRGGCYGSKKSHLRCATRVALSPSTLYHLVGLRIARDP
jgi:formylglycine-generating enzyme required for sulfatase activity